MSAEEGGLNIFGIVSVDSVMLGAAVAPLDALSKPS